MVLSCGMMQIRHSSHALPRIRLPLRLVSSSPGEAGITFNDLRSHRAIECCNIESARNVNVPATGLVRDSGDAHRMRTRLLFSSTDESARTPAPEKTGVEANSCIWRPIEAEPTVHPSTDDFPTTRACRHPQRAAPPRLNARGQNVRARTTTTRKHTEAHTRPSQPEPASTTSSPPALSLVPYIHLGVRGRHMPLRALCTPSSRRTLRAIPWPAYQPRLPMGKAVPKN
ncbi:hypothetical protein C8Q73DRAFT_192970 [Cubamyces lactineus]|nr:hypothetical protein C8Q73DRAFT_192970 [Cubamyces lactineus]